MKKIAIIGWGNQAKAWALNLKDSGLSVLIGLRPDSKSHTHAKALGFSTFTPEKIPDDVFDFVMLIPDEAHFLCLQSFNFKQGSRLYYAHGYSLLYQKIPETFKELEHILLAPKSIASKLRFLYEIHGTI